MAGFVRWFTLCYLLLQSSVKALSSKKCSFDKGFCDWKNENDLWRRIDAKNITETGLPSQTRPGGDGFYVALKKQKESAKLIDQSISAGRACLGLWYFLSTGRKNTINVKFDKSVTLKSSNEFIWMHVYININPTAQNNVEIEGHVDDNDGYVAVDDTLIDTGNTCTADCNFDYGWCAWEHVKGADRWKRLRGGSSIGPLNDHTKGDGFYISNSESGSRTQLSVLHEGNGDICLTLWYFMYGDSRINIYIKTHALTNRSVHTIQGGQSDKWKKSQKQFFQKDFYELLVESVIKSGSTGDISIDDISIKKGICEQDEKMESPVIVYVLVPLLLVALIVIGLVAFIVWRRKRQRMTKTQEGTKSHASSSFSNKTYHGHDLESENQHKSVSADSEYAVIADGNVHLQNDKAAYDVLNANDKEKHERELGYSRLKPSPATFVDKSYSHVSQNNEENNSQNDFKDSIGKVKGDQSMEPKFPFEIEEDLDIDYDHAKAGTADAEKPDNYSHLITADGINHDLDKTSLFQTGEKRLNKTQEAGTESALARGIDNHHDYHILQKDKIL